MERPSLPAVNGEYTIITHSEMSTFKRCQRRWAYQYILGLVPATEAEPLRIGSIFHEGLDLLAKGSQPAEAAQRCIELFLSPRYRTDDWALEAEIVCRLLYAYHWHYSQFDGITVLHSEIGFEVPIINPETGRASTSTKTAGKIDKIVRLPDGRIAIMEHKTSTEDISPTSDYWRRLRIDTQISHYMSAAKQLGFDVQAVLYDVIRKPGIRPRRIQKKELDEIQNSNTYHTEEVHKLPEPNEEGHLIETPRMYGARLMQDIISRPEWYFGRAEIPRLDADMDDYRWELWQMQQMRRDAAKHQRYIRNTAECMRMGKCPYFDICTSANPFPAGIPEGFMVKTSQHPELKGAEA